MATAGVALLVSPTSWSHHWVWVAPFLLVAAASAWRARSFTWLGVTVAVGRGVRRGAAPARPAPRRQSWTIDQQIFGGTYVWFTVLLFVVLWWRWRAAR